MKYTSEKRVPTGLCERLSTVLRLAETRVDGITARVEALFPYLRA